MQNRVYGAGYNMPISSLYGYVGRFHLSILPASIVNSLSIAPAHVYVNSAIGYRVRCRLKDVISANGMGMGNTWLTTTYL